MPPSALINSRSLSALSSFEKELHFEPGKNYLFDLSYLSSLAVIGERAAEFLQGQLSCDVREISATTMRQGAICNLKGRVLALLDVLDWQGFQLILPQDLLVETQNSLSKTALLSRVSLKPMTHYHFFGFYLNNKNDLLAAELPLPDKPLAVRANTEACCYALDKRFYVFIISNELTPRLTTPFINAQQMRGSLAWHQLQLEHKRIEIYPESRGLFLPHRIDLHLSGFLNFDKGCYKGQEIVARTHYRAKLKHGLRVFKVNSEEPLLVGKRLFLPEGQSEIGELIDYCPLGNHDYLIAVSILFEHPNEVLIEGQQKPVLIRLLET